MSVSLELAGILFQLVEAYRSVPRDSRQPIQAIATQTSRNWHLSHPGLSSDHPGIYPADFAELQQAGVLRIVQSNNYMKFFDITALGFSEYERLRTATGSSAERIQNTVRTYVEAESFRRRHPTAYEKWERAENLLWKGESAADYSAIGHYCREVAQEFGTSLLSQHPNAQAPTEPEKAKARVAAVVAMRATGSSRVDSHNRALLDYWTALVNLDQRQEHGSQKVSDPLTWEDGRRVVFATLFAMTEIDRVVNRPSRDAT